MIHIEQTPNPDSLKFLTQKILSKVGTEEFKKSNLDKINIPFVKEILNFSGVELVLISNNFLTIKKTLYINFAKIMLSTLIAIYSFYWCLSYFAQNLVYSSKFKILYLLFIVIFVALLYFLTCYLFKVLNLRKFRVR